MDKAPRQGVEWLLLGTSACQGVEWLELGDALSGNSSSRRKRSRLGVVNGAY